MSPSKHRINTSPLTSKDEPLVQWLLFSSGGCQQNFWCECKFPCPFCCCHVRWRWWSWQLSQSFVNIWPHWCGGVGSGWLVGRSDNILLHQHANGDRLDIGGGNAFWRFERFWIRIKSVTRFWIQKLLNSLIVMDSCIVQWAFCSAYSPNIHTEIHHNSFKL